MSDERMGCAEDFRAARAGLRLELASMADALDVEPDVLAAIEDGSQAPSAQVRLRVRKLLGLGLLTKESLAESPVAMLFRSASPEIAQQATRELAADDSLMTFGDFISSQRDLLWLEDMLDCAPSRSWLEACRPRAVPGSQHPALHGRQLAAEARRILGLAEDPIPSMLELLERLGVDVVWAPDASLTTDIEGASVAVPTPAILVNPKWGSDKWWHTRMTLAHELCHLLYDRDLLDNEATFAIISPRRPPSKADELGAPVASPVASRPTLWGAFDTLAAREQRANAFAAYFLVPPRALASVVSGLDPRSDDAILRVVRAFGVGWDAAVNLLKHCSPGVSEPDRRAMQARGRVYQPPADEFASDGPSRPPTPRRGRLALRVGQALREDLIDEIDARILLGLNLSDPLPTEIDVPDAMRQPVIIPEAHALRQADVALWRSFPHRTLQPRNARRVIDGWEFDVVEQGAPERILDILKLSDRFEVVRLPQLPERPAAAK